MGCRRILNLCAKQGEGRKVRTEFHNAGTPTDLTGWDFKATVRNAADEAVGVFTFGGTPGTATGAITVTAMSGVMLITFSAVWTVAQAVGEYDWDCLATPDDGREPFFPFGGTFTIEEPETRP